MNFTWWKLFFLRDNINSLIKRINIELSRRQNKCDKREMCGSYENWNFQLINASTACLIWIIQLNGICRHIRFIEFDLIDCTACQSVSIAILNVESEGKLWNLIKTCTTTLDICFLNPYLLNLDMETTWIINFTIKLTLKKLIYFFQPETTSEKNSFLS